MISNKEKRKIIDELKEKNGYNKPNNRSFDNNKSLPDLILDFLGL